MKIHPEAGTGTLQQKIARSRAQGNRPGWVCFLLAAVGIGTVSAQQVPALNYYWVDTPPLQEAQKKQEPRVIRVLGEKGEKYAPVYDYTDGATDITLLEVRVKRQAELREEALRLAEMLINEGTAPTDAYEKAWVTVYGRHWLRGEWALQQSALDEIMEMVLATDESHPLTDEQVRHALRALLADDARLETAAGRELLNRLARDLRARGYGKGGEGIGANDELMQAFADALRHGYSATAAFRDALFKTHRDRIRVHTLQGYVAPWGMGLSRALRYRQAPQKVTTTEGSANTQPPQQPANTPQAPEAPSPALDFTAGMNPDAGKLENFLATAPDSTKKEDDEEALEKEEADEADSLATTETAAVVYPTMFRSYSSRMALPRAVAAAAGQPDFIWAGSTDNNTWKAGGDDTTISPWQGGAVYTDGSDVLFDSDSSSDVKLDGTVRPGSITVSGTTPGTSSLKELGYTYAFTDHGSIGDYSGGATSISVEGSATLVLNTSNTFSGGINMAAGTSLYLGCDNAAGTGAITMGDSAKLIVNYNSADQEYRTPTVENALNLTGNTASVSFGTASYADNNKLPCEWRTVNLTGGVTGSGTLELRGYTYLSKSEDGTVVFNYVSDFAVNRQNAAGDALFTGTVKLRNEFNSLDVESGVPHEITTTSKELPRKILAGSVQLTLVDDVFCEATLDLTRDVADSRMVGHVSGGSEAKENKAITSNNIVVLSNSSQIKVKALEAAFLNRGWKYVVKSNGRPMTASYGIDGKGGPYSQAEERWNVRVVTDGYTDLVLEDSSDTKHVFSGSMGFAHSYTNATQAYIDVNNPGNPGGGSLGVENLSLEKWGASEQYIHTAMLQDLSVVGGTLGFNHLTLNGNLNLISGSSLVLGSNANTAVNQINTGTYEKWSSISGTSYDTTDTVTIANGKHLTVVTLPTDSSAEVTGSLTMGTGSSLFFDIHTPSPSESAASAHLCVSGTLTLQSDTAVSVNLSSTDFITQALADKYYLASAGKLSVDADGKFIPQLIPLGHGYFGSVEVEGNNLVLRVDGDPRRTWSGMTTGTATGPDGKSYKPHEWYSTAYESDQMSMAFDSRWKENHLFQPGQIVLFGNLYEPIAWDETNHLTSNQTVVVDGKTLNNGTLVGETKDVDKTGAPYSFSIDGESVTSLGLGDGADRTLGYQAVHIVEDVAPMSVVINSAYTKQMDGVSQPAEDATNYYFYGDGSIGNADATSLGIAGFGASSGTNLRKMGWGTAVIATNNTFTGGTTIEGGRLVMQHMNALGTGEITMYNTTPADAEKPNIPILQGDFSDERDGDDWAERIGAADLSAYIGEGMDTTTILNTVNVVLQTGSQGGLDTERVDARIANAHDKKLVLSKLKGDYGSVVSLYGHSNTSGQYTYAVFKVLNPGEFYGTIVMDGNILGAEENDTGGKVQMEIMTTTKSATDADWLNAVIDLSIRNGTERTVLALDALGGVDSADSQTALIDALTGTGNDGKLINSSVVSMSHDKAVTLEIEGQRGGDYDGVLGFGDFQKTVEYAEAVSTEAAVGAAAEQIAIGNVAHHYGLAGSVGELNVLKKGSSLQSVNSAMLNKLEVQGGYFQADNALVASTLKSKDGAHILVGSVSTDHSHALVVGKNGILAFDSNAAIGSKDAVDAFAELGAGVPMSLKEVISGSTTSIEVVDPSSFVLFTDGATITAHGDWYTNCKHPAASMTVGETKYTSSAVPVSIDIATGASVTINTHNYTPDATINASNDVFGRYNSSHVIQLLGEMKGHDVKLTFNNELISAAAQKDGSAGSTGSMMGYAAIRDLHQFSGDSSVTVKAMTTLQVNGTSDSSAASADEPAPLYEEQMVVNVQGNQSAIQFTDALFTNDRKYQVDEVTLEDGGHALIGGALKNTTSAEETTLDMSSVETAVTHRGAETASITNLNMKDSDSGTQVELGGTADETSVVTNAAVSTTGTATNLKIHQTELHNSMVQLHKDCSLNLAEAVVVESDSVVRGSEVVDTVATAAELQSPLFPTEAGNEATTSVGTTVQTTLTNTGQTFTSDTGNKVLVLQMNQFQGVNVTGSGLTLQLTEQSAHFLDWGYNAGAQYVAIQVSGGSGWFLFEEQDSGFASDIDTDYKLMGSDGVQITGTWVTATTVGTNVSTHLLYFNVPEPTTTTLSLAALVALCARRRRH